MSVKNSIKGADALMKKLQRLERKSAKSAVRKGARAGGAVLLGGVRDATPVDEGKLKKMMTLKVTNRGLAASAIVGADVAKLRAAAENKGEGWRPSNLDHLVEKGHVTPDGRFVPPSGFMQYAADVTMGAAEAAYVEKVAAEIESEATR